MERFGVCALMVIFAQAVLGGSLHDQAGRIIGGVKAPEGRYPYVSSLSMSGVHVCGGVILNENWIVTAAHCVHYRFPKSIKVVVGTNQLDKGGDSYDPIEIFWHENYNSQLFQNDIAVVRVKTIKFNNRVQPIPVMIPNIAENIPVSIVGWGMTRLGDPMPNDLQYLNVSTISEQQCQNSDLAFPIVPSQLCTLSKQGEGACYGDTGGPVIYTDNSNVDHLVGLYSWGSSCALGVPDVHTRIYWFTYWLKKMCNDCIKLN